jgi:hypothetical protein
MFFACSSEQVNDWVVTYGDKNVKQIILIENNLFKQKRIFKDAETIGVFIEAIENTEKTPSFELMLIKSDYDLVLKFEDNTEKKYLLTLKNDSKTGLLIDSEDSAYRIPADDTTKLKEIITE